MMTQEPTYPCPKCGQPFPMTQMNQHWTSCPGRVVHNTYPNQALSQTQPYSQLTPQQMYPQQHAPQAPIYVPPPPPKHQHLWFENDTYKVCLDQSCKQISPKLRGTWSIFVRYGLKMFWIELVIALGIAFYAVSLIHH